MIIVFGYYKYMWHYTCVIKGFELVALPGLVKFPLRMRLVWSATVWVCNQSIILKRLAGASRKSNRSWPIKQIGELTYTAQLLNSFWHFHKIISLDWLQYYYSMVINYRSIIPPHLYLLLWLAILSYSCCLLSLCLAAWYADCDL